MAWGAGFPNLRIRPCKTYDEAKKAFDELYNPRYGEANITEGRPSRTNYALVKRGDDISLRMYLTYVVTWHPDGAISYVEYDSGITREVQSRFGPISIFKFGYRQWKGKWLTRFGSYNGPHYPFGDITIDKDGYVHGLSDRFERVREDAKPQRKKDMKIFREQAMPRLMLGEFGDRIAEWRTTGFAARVPHCGLNIFHALIEGASSESIDERLELNGSRVLETGRVFGRHPAVALYPTYAMAAAAVGRALMRDRQAQASDYEDYDVGYGPINVKEI